jgi:diguanylate cyclase (GGDEF)-like protein/PAS domain S-box-containing protein
VPYTPRVSSWLFVSLGVVAGLLLLFLLKRWGSSPRAPEGPSQPSEWPERSLREVLDNVQLAGVFLDATGAVVWCNKYLLALLGEPEAAVVGLPWLERFVPADQRARRALFLEKAGVGATFREQGEVIGRGGERRLIEWDTTVLPDRGGSHGSASIGVDITERRRTEERLRHGAMIDALTGLPNRNLFVDRLAGCMARAKRRPAYRFAALFLNIDRFKVINDGLGHQAGDTLLIEVGQRLAKCLRPGDSVARLGGDDFAILVDDMPDAEVPSLVVARIQSALSVPFEIAGRDVFLTASIGTALNKPRYSGPDDFMRDAETALHHAKAQGKARHEVFDTSMHTRALVLAQLENDLHGAVEREELSLHYQPILSLKTDAVVGFEALVRWERSGHFVPTLDFVRIAEETGLILPLGAWVLREACRQLRTWQDKGVRAGEPLIVSVNLSARQFGQADLVSQVAQTVHDTGVAPGSLKLEVTESILMQEPEAAAAMLAELRSQGVRICIDDFGTGYSSLSYLLRFPAQTLKIDRSFVSDLATGVQHAEMVRTIILLARNLGMDVIAEGVETEDQLQRLRAMDCDFVQGYLVSRPVNAAGAWALLQGGKLRGRAAGAPS